MKTYEMRLEDLPFAATEKNKKTIEVRLNDDKRKGIHKGDFIRFIRLSDNKFLEKRVVNVRHYKSLQKLVEAERFECTGSIYRDTEHWFQEVCRYYAQDLHKKYGLVVFELGKAD